MTAAASLDPEPCEVNALRVFLGALEEDGRWVRSYWSRRQQWLAVRSNRPAERWQRLLGPARTLGYRVLHEVDPETHPQSRVPLFGEPKWFESHRVGFLSVQLSSVPLQRIPRGRDLRALIDWVPIASATQTATLEQFRETLFTTASVM